MLKLTELNDDVKVISDCSETVYTVKDIRDDLNAFQKDSISFFTAKEYMASISAVDILDNAIENEHDNMYEDWDESIYNDITEEDAQRIQNILDEILGRNKLGNTSYYQDKEIDIFS